MKDEVEEFFEALCLHKKYVMKAGEKIGGIPEERLIKHDVSKFSEAEYSHYARQFHGDKGDPAGFTKAVLHHFHHNDHHWQHWMFPSGSRVKRGSKVEPKGCVPMPEVCAREMVADWMGASMSYANSWDMTEWLNRNLDLVDLEHSRVKIHSHTADMLAGVLKDVGYDYGEMGWHFSPK